MEKQTIKAKSKIARFLPKAAKAMVSFQSLPFTPGRDRRSSGPLIPARSQQRKTNSYQTQEPTSPKISCMGQIKNKHDRSKANPNPVDEPKKKTSGLKKILSAGRKSDAWDSLDHRRAPSISHMRRFASSRDALSDFDWMTARIAPEENRAECDLRDADAVLGLALKPRQKINLWKRRSMAQPKPIQVQFEDLN